MIIAILLLLLVIPCYELIATFDVLLLSKGSIICLDFKVMSLPCAIKSKKSVFLGFTILDFKFEYQFIVATLHASLASEWLPLKTNISYSPLLVFVSSLILY